MKIRFLDSYRFLNSSLDTLANLLTKDQLKISNAEYAKENLNQHQIDLLSSKGCFPYEYLNCWERLNDRALPSREKFYSSLKQAHVSIDEFNRAEDIWVSFNIQTLFEYSNRYLKTDVLLLVDILNNYRIDCFDVYGLDPYHFFTGCGFAFSAMLFYTNVCLELISDIDIMLFIEMAIKGGVSVCINRYAKSNNPFEPNGTMSPIPGELYDYLMYYDYNSLYKR